MRLLKKSGMNKDKLNNSKLDLDDSLKTYKYGGEVFYKTPIMKKIQIPSRRSSSNNRIRNHIEKLGGDPNSLHPDLRQNFFRNGFINSLKTSDEMFSLIDSSVGEDHRDLCTFGKYGISMIKLFSKLSLL